jgi:hypothetical protein
MTLPPETGGQYLERGYERELRVAQYVTERDIRVIERELAEKGKAEVDTSHVSLPVTYKLPDGTAATERLHLPGSVEGVNPWGLIA